MPLTSDSEPTMYNNAQKSLHYGGGRTNGGAKTNNINNSQFLEVDNGVGPRPLHGGRSSSHSSNSSANNNPILNHKNSHNGLNGAKGGTYSSGHHSNGSNMSLPSGGGGGRATSVGGGATERLRSGAYEQSDYSNGAHSWPILFAVIPPLGALLFGKSDIFSDMLTLILISFFLYNIIKVPWELYYAARTRRVLLTNVNAKVSLDPLLEQRRQSAAASLRRQEFLSLLLVLASPFIGGYTLQYLKTFFSSYENYLSVMNIELFIVASGIRPLTHLISLLKARALHLQEQVHYPDSEVESLKRKVASIEAELTQLRRAVATKRDVLQVQDSVEPTLHQLTKQIKRHDKKEVQLRSYAEERFATIDDKMREYDTYLTYRITEEQHRATSLLFLPINILVAVVSYCTYFVPNRLAGIAGSKPQSMLKNAPVPAAIGDGTLNDTSHNHPSKLSGRHQPSHNPITSSRETARLY
ncbi:hypothetical protein BGZ96_006721 [Linnemannia gamsii]|uniref:Uncharacterized protein n=1 Tax=Linnemannia gamsii TaxID=64522 RepID=A0ABQ7K2F4_9FUNG|nr:hypothetical protein BGZ96_006721 [Linnemannia gamsii]